MAIRTVGVVGCGLMGAGIAETMARGQYNVIVREINAEVLQRGLERLQQSMATAVAREKMSQWDADAAWARIRGITDLEDMAECDLVIEAAVENLDLKREVFAALDRITPAHAILASNTSSLSIAAIAAATRPERRDKVIGMHFFNPVPVMKLVEIIRSVVTSDETFATIRDLSVGLGKEVVVAKDYPGFIVNLLLIPYLLDAVRALELGIASQEDIDKGIQLGLNHPMGPLTLLDFVGLDTTLFIADAMFAETGDARYAARPLLRRMVSVGLNGRKVGRGFYEYGKK